MVTSDRRCFKGLYAALFRISLDNFCLSFVTVPSLRALLSHQKYVTHSAARTH
jgi:hypothetical protein